MDFLQEARLAAQLDHPNIIDIYDVNVESQFIAMELVNGGTLRDILSKYKRLLLHQARTIIIQLCQGLQVAHNAGVLHRDIKPANIFVTQKKRVKLGDFGIAHITNLEQNAFTQLSAQIGTLPYMSPEQIRGGHLSVASDIYAVGVVFYEMLTGELPLGRFAPPSQKVQVDVRLDEVVLHTLEKEPQRRYQ